MEELYNQSKTIASETVKIDNYKKIISIYDGTMLPKLNSEIWLINIASKYKTICCI